MGDANRDHSPAELALRDQLVDLTAHLPEREVIIDGHGHITLKVAGKTFVYLGEGESGLGISVKTDKVTQAELIATGRYTRTRYIGQHGWVSLQISQDADMTEIQERLTESYWRVAPKRLVKQMEAG